MRFKIIRVDEGYVLAERLDPADFSLEYGGTLGGIELQPLLTQPRAIDASGRPRLDVFAFYPVTPSDTAQLERDAVVELRPRQPGHRDDT